MSFYGKVVLGAGTIVAVAVAILLFWPNPEAAELEKFFRELEELARKRDVDGCMKRVHAGYDYDGLSYADVERQARLYIGDPANRIEAIRGLDVEVHGEDGRARFEADLILEYLGYRVPRTYDITVHFHKFQGTWKIIGYDVAGERP